jgi:hypothetical protein
MFRQYNEPKRENFDTEEEYQEAVEAYDVELIEREKYLQSKKRQPYNPFLR